MLMEPGAHPNESMCKMGPKSQRRHPNSRSTGVTIAGTFISEKTVIKEGIE